MARADSVLLFAGTTQRGDSPIKLLLQRTSGERPTKLEEYSKDRMTLNCLICGSKPAQSWVLNHTIARSGPGSQSCSAVAVVATGLHPVRRSCNLAAARQPAAFSLRNVLCAATRVQNLFASHFTVVRGVVQSHCLVCGVVGLVALQPLRRGKRPPPSYLRIRHAQAFVNSTAQVVSLLSFSLKLQQVMRVLCYFNCDSSIEYKTYKQKRRWLTL